MNMHNSGSGSSRGSHRGQGRGSGRPNRFGGRGKSSGNRQMFDAECAECNSACKVPFEPSSGKPVYCSSCFEKRDGGDSRSNRSSYGGNRSYPPRGNRPSENYTKQFEMLDKKLEKILSLLSQKESTDSFDEIE